MAYDARKHGAEFIRDVLGCRYINYNSWRGGRAKCKSEGTFGQVAKCKYKAVVYDCGRNAVSDFHCSLHYFLILFVCVSFSVDPYAS